MFLKSIVICLALVLGSLHQQTPSKAVLRGPIAAQKGSQATYSLLLTSDDANTVYDGSAYSFTFTISPAIPLYVVGNTVSFVPGNGPYTLNGVASGPDGTFETSRLLRVIR